MARNQASIREVQMMRGVNFSAGGIKERLKKYSFLVNVLLLSSLEGSLEIAESMQARAFGSGPRTCYKRETWRPRDTFCLSSSLVALGIAAWGVAHGIGVYQYYPHLGPLINGKITIVLLAAVLFPLTIPVLLSWGWHHCFYLKSKM
jgi:energy-coupling factor transport system permease protein